MVDFSKYPEKMKETVLSIIGLAVAVLGIQMGFESNNFIIVIISLVVGTVIGEWLDLERCLIVLDSGLNPFLEKKDKIADRLQKVLLLHRLFLLLVQWAIIGALDSGIRNDHNVLITKGIIDGFTSIILASTLGIGVLLSAIPVFFIKGQLRYLQVSLAYTFRMQR